MSRTEAQREIPTMMGSVTIFIRKVLIMSSYTTEGVVSAPPHSLILSVAAFANGSLKFLSGFIGSGKRSVLLLPGIPACCCMPHPKRYAPSPLNTDGKGSAPRQGKKKKKKSSKIPLNEKHSSLTMQSGGPHTTRCNVTQAKRPMIYFFFPNWK